MYNIMIYIINIFNVNIYYNAYINSIDLNYI